MALGKGFFCEVLKHPPLGREGGRGGTAKYTSMQACQESLQPGRGQGFVVLVTLCPAVSAYILACPFVNFYLFCTAAICCSIFSSKPESYFLYTICFFLTFSEHFRTIIYKIHSAVKSYFSRG